MTNSGFSFNKDEHSLVEFASISIWACILSFCGVFSFHTLSLVMKEGKYKRYFCVGGNLYLFL